MNGEPLEEVDCFTYQGSPVAADGGCEMDEVYRMNEGDKAWGPLKSTQNNRGLRIHEKKCQYEGVIVPWCSMVQRHGVQEVLIVKKWMSLR